MTWWTDDRGLYWAQRAMDARAPEPQRSETERMIRKYAGYDAETPEPAEPAE